MTGSKFQMNPIDVSKVNTKYRCINTKLPVPESLSLIASIEKYESRCMRGQLPIVWDKAEGFQIFDPWGNKWIDFTSTIFVANSGHANPRVIKALKEQLDKPLLHNYTYPTKIRADFLEYLIGSTNGAFDKACLYSSGTEATECANRLMRLNGWKNEKKRPGIVAFEGCYHGETMGARMLSYNSSQKEWIGYHDPNIYHVPFPYPWRNEAISDPRGYFRKGMRQFIDKFELDPRKDLCGFILETFQGWGAVFYPDDYLQELMAFAHEHNMLVTFDEMQAGFGRTGKLFGYMNYKNVTPDLICCGKGASSSVPLSFVLGKKEIMDLPDEGAMHSTHSANPVACAAGLANLKALIEDGLVENSRVLGEVFFEKLNAVKRRFPNHVKYVLGKGLLAAVHFVDAEGKPLSKLATRISEIAMRKGILVVCTGRESIKLAPPLCITEEALLEGVDVFEESIEEGISQC